MTEQLDLLEQGRANRDEGMARASASTDDFWRRTCDQGIAKLARTGQTFQSYDLVLAGVPEPAHPNQWGPRFSAAAKRGVIEPVGWGPSLRPTTAASAVRLWRGVSSS